MNIISQFNQFLEKNFNFYLKNYFNFINDLDSFSDSFIKDIFKGYFEYFDNSFFNSSYRKNYCTSNGFYERKNYVTLFGEITFKRRYYYDRKLMKDFSLLIYF